MTKYIVKVVLSLFLLSNTATVFSQERSLYPSKEQLFEESAIILYLAMLGTDTLHPNYNNPIIDTIELNKIKHQLRLMNSFLANSDSLAHLRNIRPRGNVGNASFYFTMNGENLKLKYNNQVDSSAIPQELKSFIAEYSLHSLQPFFELERGMIYKIMTNEYYNYYGLSQKMEELKVIDLVDYKGGYVLGGGDDLTIETIENKLICKINISWGDCPAGCMYGKYWEFEIKDDSVTLVRAFSNTK